MRWRSLLAPALLVAVVLSVPAGAQPPRPPVPVPVIPDDTPDDQVPTGKGPDNGVLDRVYLSPAEVAFEIDYEGSPHTGCYTVMRAIAVFRVTGDDGLIREEKWNVSGSCAWAFSDTDVYTAYTGEYGNLSDDGLLVSWEWGPEKAGSTGVTVTYQGKSAGGTITATDSR